MDSDFPYVLSDHASAVIAERQIPLAWVARVLSRPTATHADREDPELRHALGPIPEYGGRVLRVVYNSNSSPMAYRDGIFRSHAGEAGMKVHVDEAAGAVYLRLDDSKIVESQEVETGIVLDFNADNHVVGIEILRIKERVPTANLKQVQFEVG